MTESRYEIVVTVPAVRAIRETLPEAVAFAVIDFITGPLLDNPRRVPGVGQTVCADGPQRHLLGGGRRPGRRNVRGLYPPGRRFVRWS